VGPREPGQVLTEAALSAKPQVHEEVAFRLTVFLFASTNLFSQNRHFFQREADEFSCPTDTNARWLVR